MFERIRVVLVETSHPGNIGAVARAMKTMGLARLYLVRPAQFPHPKANELAAGADDLLAGAVVTSTLHEAVAGCRLVMGTSARSRAIPLERLDPREAARKAVAEAARHEVAIVFGPERTGLENDQLLRCHFRVWIPTVPTFSSLNLAAAVQVMAYELYMAGACAEGTAVVNDDTPVSVAGMERFYEHLRLTLIEIGFLDVGRPGQVMRRLRRLFNRARVETNEMNILRGILSKGRRSLAAARVHGYKAL